MKHMWVDFWLCLVLIVSSRCGAFSLKPPITSTLSHNSCGLSTTNIRREDHKKNKRLESTTRLLVASSVVGSTKGKTGFIAGTYNGFIERAAYDPQFATKIAIEMVIGFATQLFAEIAKRGSRSWLEIDFIVADIVMGLTANFFAVYLSAPTGASKDDTSSHKNQSPVEKFFSNCPDNAFQISEKYTVLQRFGSILKVAPKLFGIGFVAMAVGSSFTHILSVARSSLSTSIGGLQLFTSLFHGFVDAFKISLAIGVYLAVSTNLRYQFVAGIMEARVIDPLFHILFPSKLLYAVGSFVVRTSNTFVGSAQMIDYLVSPNPQSSHVILTNPILHGEASKFNLTLIQPMFLTLI